MLPSELVGLQGPEPWTLQIRRLADGMLCHLLTKKGGKLPPSFLVGLQGLEPWTR